MSDAHAAPAPAPRAGDTDRDRITSTLGDAAAAGYLQMDELDERLGRALGARTIRELDVLLTDLPAHWLAERARGVEGARERGAARAGLGPHVRSYAAVMTLLVAIWLVVGLTADAWYPWPVWPALGWGVGIAGRARAAYSRESAC